MTGADPVVVLFADRMHREREARGWTLRDLGARADVSASALCRTEQEQACPSLITAVRVAKALGIPLGELVDTPLCGVCDATPPAGFICASCGRKGDAT